MFFHFWRKFRKFKMAAMFWGGEIFFKLTIVHSSYTLWVENFNEIGEIFRKFENSKWPPFLGRGKFFEN